MKTQKELEIQSLNLQYSQCNLCKACLNKKKIFGNGNLDSNIIIIGGCPGQSEFDLGVPFVDDSGKLLDKIFKSVDINREDIYLTTSIICKISGETREPNKQEVENCKNRLLEEIDIVDPKVCVLVGQTALNTFFPGQYSLLETHGQWLTDLTYFFFPLLHPSFILCSHTEDEKKAKKMTMWKDIIKFKTELDIFLSIN